MIVLVIVQTIAIAILGVIVFGLLRTHADILRALDRAGVPLEADTASAAVGPMPVASPRAHGDAVDIVGSVPGGGPVKVAVAGDHHTLLAFLSSGCRTCASFWTEFASPLIDLPGHDTRLVIVAQDPAHDSESKLVELAPPGVRTVCSSDAWTAYGVPGSPYFALVDGRSGAVVGSGTATGWEQVRGLLSQALGDEEISGSADDALAASGIGPGHPTLYPDPSWDAGVRAPSHLEGSDAGVGAPSHLEGWDAGVGAPSHLEGWDAGVGAPSHLEGWDGGVGAPSHLEGWDGGVGAPSHLEGEEK